MATAVEYISRDSPVHRLNALTKIVWALVVLVAALMFNDYRYLLMLLASVLLVALAARILGDFRPAAVGLFIFAIILLLIQSLFYDDGKILFHLIPGVNYIAITDKGLLSGIAMAARMMTLVLSFMVFLTTTRTQEIVLTLVERLKIPYDYAFMFMTALRFIPTFLGEVRQVSQAQQARGHALEGFNPIKKIKAYAPVTVPLVLISLNKAEYLAMAMETRGYGGGHRTYLREPRMGHPDYCMVILLFLFLVMVVSLRWAGFGIMY